VTAIINLSRPTQILNRIIGKFCFWEDLQSNTNDILSVDSKENKDKMKLELSEDLSIPDKTKVLTKPVNVFKSMIDYILSIFHVLIRSI